ncbi:unnamed protein product [Trichogramma brassicae]|uniref:Uncharacterized protein n=1 Tax=Trichogramma brassicae TaxID=86971 RepID=A0A6H5IY14_9HYME|nr:unnamed protein product [Trichogramma brassicae]
MTVLNNSLKVAEDSTRGAETHRGEPGRVARSATHLEAREGDQAPRRYHDADAGNRSAPAVKLQADADGGNHHQHRSADGLPPSGQDPATGRHSAATSTGADSSPATRTRYTGAPAPTTTAAHRNGHSGTRGSTGRSGASATTTAATNRTD